MSKVENVNVWHEFLLGKDHDAPEPTKEEWELQSERMNNPLIVTYAIAPAPPPSVGTFLSPNMESVYLDYDSVPWKRLASELQDQLNELGVPKNIKAFVGTDAIDIHDLMDSEQDDNFDPIRSARKYIKQMPYKDSRAGIMQFRGEKTFHLSAPQRHERTPPAAIFIGFRFNNAMQVHDYLTTITDNLLDTPDDLAIRPGVYDSCPLPDTIKDWYESACNVVVGQTMDVYRLGVIYR
ncbi:hypothetical protein [Marinobacter sp.]|uniref:hypothetical protein n=1 Tax=Marinobacter sp. TaxID=50741 RepID=UPI0026045C24|nr:hypothetical protein [Marinobacter sp.]